MSSSSFNVIFTLGGSNAVLLKEIYQKLIFIQPNFLGQRILLKKTKKRISILRSPHVNKNAQEHFHQYFYLHKYRTVGNTKQRAKEFHQQLRKLIRRYPYVSASSSLKVTKINFKLFFNSF